MSSEDAQETVFSSRDAHELEFDAKTHQKHSPRLAYNTTTLGVDG